MEKASVVDDVLRNAGFSTSAISEVKGGGIYYAGSFNSSASDKELSVKLAFHIKIPNLDIAKEIYLNSPLKKEYDPTVESLGMIAVDGLGSIDDFSCIKLGKDYTKVMNKLYNSACPGYDLNLSTEEIVMFQQKQRKKDEDVTNCLHQVLLNRYRSYKQYGLKGIQPYARSSTNNFYPGEELRAQWRLVGSYQKQRLFKDYYYQDDNNNNNNNQYLLNMHLIIQLIHHHRVSPKVSFGLPVLLMVYQLLH